ncbi:MAG: choice-of-anchor D domain-containing protein [bacterium]
MKSLLTICCSIAVTIILFESVVDAQSITNYSLAASSGSYTPLSSGTAVSWSGANYSPAIPLGFDFYYMGTKYKQVYTSWAGFLTFNSAALSHDPYTEGNHLGSSITEFRPLIAPLWDDAVNSASGKYRTDGITGNRTFTFEWVSVKWAPFAGDATISYQLILYEATGKIEFVYQQLDGDINNPSASIGLAAAGTGANNFLSLDTTGTHPNASSTIAFDSLNAKPATGQVYAFTPAGTSAPTNLTFSNVGARGMDLHWTDTATDELRYEIYSSTDGTTYAYVDSVAANSNYYTAKYLSPNTTYYWKVFAVREFLSTPLTSSQTTGSPSLSGTKTVGPTGEYPTLTAAVSAINLYGLIGNLILELQGSYSSALETFPITFANLSNAADKTVTIRPAIGASNLTISGASTSSMIIFNAGDYITIDGRPGGTGSSQELTIQNIETSGGSAISFSNDATNNIVRYCKLKSIDTLANRGVVFFGTTAIETGVGNDNNTIDHCDIDASQSGLGIYSVGSTATNRNSGNVISSNTIHDFYPFQYSTTALAAGVYLGLGNKEWIITGNSIYQTATRPYVKPTIGASATYYGVVVNDQSDGYSFDISNNYIGGSAANAGGNAWTMSGAMKFWAIYFGGTNTNAPAPSSIQGNTITNINISSSFPTVSDIFSGIYIQYGPVDIGTTTGNIIGSETTTDAISITLASSSPALYGWVSGIRRVNNHSGSTSNNIVGGFTLASLDPSVAIYFYGIYVSGTGSISNNIIGNRTVANSIVNSSGGSFTGTGFISYGIYASTGGLVVSGNTIANLNFSSTGSGCQFIGINSINGSSSIERAIANNTIRDITLAGTSATLITGIKLTVPITSGYTYSISGNQVFNIQSTHTTAAVGLRGIWIMGSTKPGVVEKNLIHGLSMATSSEATVMLGFYVRTGSTFRNNIVRLGIDASGNSITSPINIWGFYKDISSINNSYFHNTVYIGGSGVTTGAKSTSAFCSAVSTGTDTLWNNIFMNARSSVDSSGTHFAILLPNINVISDYNVYYVNGKGGNIASFDNATTSLNSINAIRERLVHQIHENQELHSAVGDPHFVNTSGAAFDLHVQSPTPAEGSGLPLASVTTDFTGNLRSSYTPTDIGAYAGTFTLADYFTPNISYTNLTPGRVGSTRVAAGITITDVGSGVPTSGGYKPRIWFRNQTKSSAWASVAGVLQSGNGNNGEWNFTIDYALSGGTPAMGDTIQYYFTAQDQESTPNIWYSPYVGANHSDVAAQISAPITPQTYVILGELSGTLNVPGDYSSLTKSDGLFAALRNAVLAGDLTINITADLTEDGAMSLASVFQEVPGTYHLSIRPNGTTVRTISGAGASGLIMLDGVRDVVIDGRYGGSGKYLLFRNTANAPTLTFSNDASLNTIVSCTFEGAPTSTTKGVVTFAAGFTTGNNQNTISGCTIRSRSDSSRTPMIGIFCVPFGDVEGTVGGSNNSIVQCEIFDFSMFGIIVNSAVQEETGNTTAYQNWTITGNTIYGLTEQTSSSQYQSGVLTGISLTSGGTANTISNNIIRDLTTIDYYVNGIVVTGSTAIISGNKLYNLVSRPAGGYIYGINVTGSQPATVRVFNNIISLVTNDSSGAYVIGLGDQYYHDLAKSYFEYNTVYIRGTAPADPSNGQWSCGYYRQGYGESYLRNNILICKRVYTGDRYENPIADDQSGGVLISNYNFCAGNGFWAGSIGMLDIAGWRSAGYGDSSSWVMSADSITTDSLFTDAANHDLNIKTNSPYAWYVNGKGIPLASVASDWNGTPRSVSVANGATDIGMDEFTPSSLPPLAKVDKSPMLRDSSIFSFAGRMLGVVRWDSTGTVPDSVQFRYYSGTPLPGSPEQKHSDGYWGIQAIGGSGYRYDLSLNFDDAILGTIISIDAMKMLKRDGGAWQMLGNSTVNLSNKTISVKGLTLFSEFAIGDTSNVVTPPGAGVFTPSKTIVSFGTVRRGTVKVDSVFIKNTGTDSLKITSVVSSNTHFTISPKDTVVKVADSIRYFITFHPDAVAKDTAFILFSHGSPVKVDTVKVVGTSIWPIFSASADSIQFPRTLVGSSKVDTLAVINTGTADLIITSVTSSDTSQFKVVPLTDTLSIGEKGKFAVRFIPSSPGSKNATIVFSQNSPLSPFTLKISGIGGATTPPWSVVQNTGKNANIAIPNSINPAIGSQVLKTGDAVGVFFKRNDSLFCAGYTAWQEGQNAAITAWGDNDQTPMKDGLTEAELMQYKIWSAELDREYTAKVLYQSGPSVNYQTNGIYVLSSLVGMITITHNIVLPKGWNMISSFVMPKDTLVDTLFAAVKLRLTIMKNNGGQVYWPGQSINTIQSWNKYHAYQIYMQSKDTLRFLGEEIDPQLTPISLPQGWNLSPYLRNTEMRVDSALKTIESSLIIVKSGIGKIYWPTFAINTIGTMKPGQGYQFYTVASSTLTYPSNTGSAPPTVFTKIALAEGETIVLEPTHYKPGNTETGSNAIILVQNGKLNDGDEIGVWTSMNKLVGSGIALHGKAVVTIWGDNSMTSESKEGASEGEVLTLTRWSQKEEPVSIISLVNGLTNAVEPCVLCYRADALWIADVKTAAEMIPVQFILDQNYPNPFNPSTTIHYGLPKDVKVSLDIYDLLGKKVASLVNSEQKAGNYTVVFQNQSLSSGVYFYTIVAGDFKSTKKLVLLK